MSCYNKKSDSTVVCPNAVEFDNLCNYNEKYPFQNINYSAKTGTAKSFWDDDRKGGKAKITFSQYTSYVAKKKGKDNISPNPNYPKETKTPKEKNNLGSVSYTEEIGKKFESSGSVKKNDGQSFAKFSNYIDGVAACMYILYKSHNGKNICQINTTYQAHKDEKYDCIPWMAHRLNWVTNVSDMSGIDPDKQLDLTNPTVLEAFVYGICNIECSAKVSKADLEKAYNLFKSKIS